MLQRVPANRYFAFFAIAIGGCLIDLLTKHWIFNRLGLPGGETLWFWEGFFGLQTSLNEGALFGMGSGFVWFFAGLSFIALSGVLLWLFVAGAAQDLKLTLALAMLAAGISGNLYDRLGLWTAPGLPGRSISAVRDWILFQYRGHVWPNFNLADCFLVCGSIWLVAQFWFQPVPVDAKQTHPAGAA